MPTVACAQQVDVGAVVTLFQRGHEKIIARQCRAGKGGVMLRRSVAYEIAMRKHAADLYMRSLKRGDTEKERVFREVMHKEIQELDRIIDEAIEKEATARAEEIAGTL